MRRHRGTRRKSAGLAFSGSTGVDPLRNRNYFLGSDVELWLDLDKDRASLLAGSDCWLTQTLVPSCLLCDCYGEFSPDF